MPNARGRLAIAAVTITALLSAAAAFASTPILVYENSAVIQGLKVRPSMLTMAADGNDTITSLHWTGWGSSAARAKGLNHVNNCIPSCADGHITTVHVAVRLFSRGYYHGNYVYECYAVKPASAAYLRRIYLP